MRDALDASFSLPDPNLVADQGFDMLVYTGPARPTQAWVDHCRSRGVIVTFIQQTVSERAQQGYNAGIYDAQYADQRVNERGHALDGSVCYVVSDGSRDNPTWNGNLIADYGQAIAVQSARPFFFYGNRYAVDHANGGAARVAVSVYGRPVANLGGPTAGGWIPATWNVDPGRDLLRQNIGYYIAAGGVCDLNTVWRDYTGGVPTPEPIEEDTLKIQLVVATPGGTAYRVWDPGNGLVKKVIGWEEAFGPPGPPTLLQTETLGGLITTGPNAEPLVWDQPRLDAIPFYVEGDTPPPVIVDGPMSEAERVALLNANTALVTAVSDLTDAVAAATSE